MALIKLALIILNLIFVASYRCVDEDGKSVDWYVVYKLPYIKKTNDGFRYMTMTSETKTWKMSSKSIKDTDSVFGRTLKNFYSENPKGFWLSYNDQIKWSFHLAYGHTKGVVGADDDGFWLVHSVPHFPNFIFNYSYPSTGRRNGQSALCVSFNKTEIDKIGELLMYNKPSIWRKVTPKNLASVFPKLYSAAEGDTVEKPPWYTSLDLFSVDNFKFRAFAKSARFGKDLYELVAQSLRVDLFVETWRLELNPLPSYCTTPYKVINVKSMEVDEISFTSFKDHSKLAVSANSTGPYVCVGDINRAEPQEKRGGGTLCFESKFHWKSYYNLINSTDSCK